jgi:methionyl-tRNA synthetase
MCSSYFEGVVPETFNLSDPENVLMSKWQETKEKSMGLFGDFQFSQGLEELSGFIRSINKYADERVPWKLAKSVEVIDQENLKTCISTMVEALRLANSLLVAVMPEVHTRINERLGLAPSEDWAKDLNWDNRLNGKQLKDKVILFPRK